MTVEELAAQVGVRVHRGRINRSVCWLLLGDVLLSPRCGTPDHIAKEILAPVFRASDIGEGTAIQH